MRRRITLPRYWPPGQVEACGLPLAYLAWLAWPSEEDKHHRDAVFYAGISSTGKAVGAPRSEFPEQLKGIKPKRADNKVNAMFDRILRDRWWQMSIHIWRQDEGVSFLEAGRRLRGWTSQMREGLGADPEDERFSPMDPNTIVNRFWREPLPVLPLTIGFYLHAPGNGKGGPSRRDCLIQGDWAKAAVEEAQDFVCDAEAAYPEIAFLYPVIPA